MRERSIEWSETAAGRLPPRVDQHMLLEWLRKQCNHPAQGLRARQAERPGLTPERLRGVEPEVLPVNLGRERRPDRPPLLAAQPLVVCEQRSGSFSAPKRCHEDRKERRRLSHEMQQNRERKAVPHSAVKTEGQPANVSERRGQNCCCSHRAGASTAPSGRPWRPQRSCRTARKGSVLDKNTAVAQQKGSAFISPKSDEHRAAAPDLHRTDGRLLLHQLLQRRKALF